MEALGYESSYFTEGGTEYDVANKIEYLNRTLTFRIVNSNPTLEIATLFDANANTAQPFGVDVAFEIKDFGGAPQVAATSHGIIRNHVKSNPIAISGSRWFVESTAQFNQNITFFKSLIGGKTTQYEVQAANYISPTNFNTLVVDIPQGELDFIVDGDVGIAVPILPNSTIDLDMTMVRTTDISNNLFDKPILQKSQWGRPTGNPIMDVMFLEKGLVP